MSQPSSPGDRATTPSERLRLRRVTAGFVGLLGWLLIEAQGGSLLGLAERLTSSLQTSWPFVVAVALRRANA